MNTSAVSQMLAVGNASLLLTLAWGDGVRLPASPGQMAVDALQHGVDKGNAPLPATAAIKLDRTV